MDFRWTRPPASTMAVEAGRTELCSEIEANSLFHAVAPAAMRRITLGAETIRLLFAGTGSKPWLNVTPRYFFPTIPDSPRNSMAVPDNQKLPAAPFIRSCGFAPLVQGCGTNRTYRLFLYHPLTALHIIGHQKRLQTRLSSQYQPPQSQSLTSLQAESGRRPIKNRTSGLRPQLLQRWPAFWCSSGAAEIPIRRSSSE